MEGKIIDTCILNSKTVFQFGFSSLVEGNFSAVLVVFPRDTLCHVNHKRHQMKTTVPCAELTCNKHNKKIFSSLEWGPRVTKSTKANEYVPF